MRNSSAWLFWGWVLGAAWPAAAQDVQSLESIRQAIVAELKSIVRQHFQNFDVEVAPLDPRLRLPPCDRPLTVVPLHAAVPIGATSVGVECRGGHPWTIYAKANVQVFERVAVLAQALPKGTVLTRDTVVLELVDTGKLQQGYFGNAEAVLGQRLKNSLPKGTVLTPRHLAPVKVVNKGDAVIIRVNTGALEVRMGGHALMDGGLGQRIRVVNDRSQRVVEGIVQGPGEVQVAF